MRKSIVTRYVLIAFFALFLLFPILRMFAFLFVRGEWSFFTSRIFLRALRNSLVSSTVSSIVAVFFALLSAYFLSRSSIKVKSVFTLLFSLPLLLPSMSLAFSLIMWFGTNGVVTRILHLNRTIYGFKGVVFASIIYAFPLAFMLLYDVLLYENTEPYESASVMGISKFSQFTHLTLAYLKKPLIAVFFSVFATVLTDYGIPLMIGSKYQTLPLVMYNEVVGMLNFSRGSLIASVLLIPCVVSFLIDALSSTHTRGQSKTKRTFNSTPTFNTITYVICVLISLVIFFTILPFVFVSFVKRYPYDLTLTFDNITKTLNLGGRRGLFNSLIIALLSSLSGVIVMFLSSYFTARMKSRSSYILHLFSIISVTVPGLVLGISYSLAFGGLPLYRSVFFIVIINLVHFASTPYFLSYNSLSKLDLNLENVGYTLGIKRFNLVKDVIVPQEKNTLIAMFSYYFMCSMTTISAVSFVANSYNEQLSLMINKFQSQFLLECAASVSLLIFLVNIVMQIILGVFKRIDFSHKKA